MKKLKITKSLVASCIFGAGIILAFQNCQKSQFTVLKSTDSAPFEASLPSASGTISLNTNEVLVGKSYSMGDVIVNEAFVNAQNNSNSVVKKFSKTAAIATGTVRWPGNTIQVYFDVASSFVNPNDFFQPAQLSALRKSFLEACARWSRVSNIQCVEIENPSSAIPFLTVTRAAVPLKWVANSQSLCSINGSVRSCATIGFQGLDRKNYLAIHINHIENMWTLTHEMGHILGLSHEHQRPGRDSFITFRSNFADAGSGDYKIITTLNPVNNDYDYGSIMHYPIANNRNPDFVNLAPNALPFTYATLDLFAENSPKHNSNLNPAGGLSVYAGFPSQRDAQAAASLYGSVSAQRSCVIYSGADQITIPHATQIGVYSTQTETQDGKYCLSSARICKDGELLAGLGYGENLLGYKSCPLKCSIAGRLLSYGQSMTYYTKEFADTQAECDASAKNIFCESSPVGRFGSAGKVDGYQKCTVRSAASTNPPSAVKCLPVARQIASTSGGASCTAYLPMASPGSNPVQAAPVTNGGTYSAICQTNGQWATNPSTSTCATTPVNNLTLNGPACDYYGPVVQVSESFAQTHCERDRTGVWTGRNFCEYGSVSVGVGTCQCKTDGVTGSDGKCYMTSVHRQAEVAAFGTSGMTPGSPRANAPGAVTAVFQCPDNLRVKVGLATARELSDCEPNDPNFNKVCNEESDVVGPAIRENESLYCVDWTKRVVAYDHFSECPNAPEGSGIVYCVREGRYDAYGKCKTIKDSLVKTLMPAGTVINPRVQSNRVICM